MHEECDVAIIGAGAAGLMTAIQLGRAAPETRIALLDGAKKIGAKILVAGGGRCNVTNAEVTPADFNAGNANILKRVLRSFTVADTIAFFRGIGVELREEEPWRKLFPTTNSARTVLAALLDEAERVGAGPRRLHRVEAVARRDDDFLVRTTQGDFVAKQVVFATGGQSLPKTGSDGFGFQLAEQLGHTIIPLTPALDPLAVSDEWARNWQGITMPARLTIQPAGAKPLHRADSLLWTHFGMSGPAVLDISRHWHRAKVHHQAAPVTVDFIPEITREGFEPFAAADQFLRDRAAAQPRSTIVSILRRQLPARVAEELPALAGVNPQQRIGQLARDARRRLAHTLTACPLQISGGRGYKYAEATAGGVSMAEITSTLASRIVPGLHFVGEILDVDGRLGGFNFQWAWSSGYVVGNALGR